MINTELQHEIITHHCDSEGRKILLKIKIAYDIFNILNIYAPNNINEKKQFFNSLYQWTENYISENYYTVIVGDFNCTLMPEDGSSGKTDICSKSLLNSLNQFNVIDIWRHKNPNKAEYSWESNTRDISSSRIDYTFLTKNLSFHTKKCCIRSAPISDHKSVIVNIKCLDNKRGPSYWKFNVSYLKDKKFCDNIEELFDSILALSENNKLLKTIAWDLFKIKDFSIKYGQNKSKLTKNEICKIEHEIQALDMAIGKNRSLIFQNKREELKHCWCNLICKSAEGAQIQAQAKYVEQGEKSTNYFLSLEKQRQICNRIAKIKTQNTETTDPNCILQECVSFYRSLYTSTHPDEENLNTYLKSCILPKSLDKEQKEFCDEPISLQECSHVVFKCMKSNKSPGLDGILFWPKIGQFLLEVYNDIFHNGELTNSQRKAVITLIFKNGDREQLKSYRPISLTNADYKILAFVLAQSLQKIMPSIIDTDQSGYIKNRFIGHNIRLIQDIIHISKNLNKPGVLMFLDFKKAVDSLEWSFLHRVIEKFNFGQNF